jgi:hypothetical protein
MCVSNIVAAEIVKDLEIKNESPILVYGAFVLLEFPI